MKTPNQSNINYPNLTRVVTNSICQKRKERKYSQYFLAEACDLTRNCIQQLECYEHIPDLTTLFKLFEALGFSEDEFTYFMLEARVAFRLDMELQRKRAERLIRIPIY